MADDPQGNAIRLEVVWNVACHELAHEYQYESSKGKLNNAHRWVVEGHATMLTNLALNKLGKDPFESGHMASVIHLRSLNPLPRLNELKWLESDDFKKRKIFYTYGELACRQLLNRNSNATFTRYFTLLGRGVNREEAFRRAFGISKAELQAIMDTWHRGR